MDAMWQRRFAGTLALLVLLAGPLGFLAADHAAFHRGCASSDAGGDREIPCPVCHFLTTTSLESPAPAPGLPGLVAFGLVESAPVPVLAPTPVLAPARSRAPPALS